MSRKFFLIGLPGSGKTTMGLEWANYLGIQFIDLDHHIEKQSTQTISQLFEEKGEVYFRQLEKIQLERIVYEIPEFVMATGGGTPCFFNNMETMERFGVTIFVNTPVKIIKRRLKQDKTRPLVRSNSLDNLFEERKSWYLKASLSINSIEELMELF